MKLKTNPSNFMLQIGNFVYDYKEDGDVEKIIVAYVNDLRYYTVYNVVNNSLVLAFTNMSDSSIQLYLNDLYKNWKFIIETGRSDKK